MTREEYTKLAVADLKSLAKERGITGISAMRKNDLINALLEKEGGKESGSGDARRSRKNVSKSGSIKGAAAGESLQPSLKSPADAKKEDEALPERGTADRPERAQQDNRESESGRGGAAGRSRESSNRIVTAGKALDPSARISGEGRSPQPAGRAAGNGRNPVSSGQMPGAGRSAGVSGQMPGAGRSTAPSGQMPGTGRSAGVSGQMPGTGRNAAPSGLRSVAGRNPSAGGQMAGIVRTGMTSSGQEGVMRSGTMNTGAQSGMQGAAQGRTPRPQIPTTRGEMRQSNPQPKAEMPESIQDRMEQDRPPMELRQLDSGNEVSGVLEVMSDGYGFIRSNNYLPGEDDVYVSPSQIRKFGLKTGDIVCGNTRVHAQQEKFSALLFVKMINGYTPSEAAKRSDFENMTPVFPNERLRMERTGREVAMRVVDILAPIGKGQRGLIVSPPKAGKTTLLKDIARSIQRNNPEMHIIIMLIDERPEEVTDIREAIVGNNVEVLDSTFDETPEHHKRVAEMGIERARRLVEHHLDVVILLDSITRLARAYNLIVPPSGRTLSGGLDPAALHPPKRFFGAARNMREGGSLTILATALVDTGSKMDDVVYEEFKGTGNMELILDRKLSERRVFPAIDITKSGTRREDLLLTTDEGEASYVMRRAMNGMKGEDAAERIIDLFARTRSNEELIQRVKHSHVI